MREIAAAEIYVAIRELGEKIVGSHLRKIYDFSEGGFRLGFYKSGKNTMLYLRLLRTINETNYSEDAQDATDFAISLRKRIENARITDFGQHGSDRIVIFTMLAAGMEYKLIVEMLGKGNIILVNAADNIELCYKNLEYKERRVAPKEAYVFPGGESVDFNLLDRVRIESIVEGLKGNMRIITELSKSINIGPLYLEDILLRSNIDPKTASIDERQKGTLKKELVDFFEALKKPQPILYRSNGEYVDYSVLPIKKYDALEAKVYPNLSELLDDLYVRDRIGTDTKKTERIKEVKINIEKQSKLTVELDSEKELSVKIANKIFENMIEINSMIKYIKEKKKVNVDEMKGMFNGIKVKDIDFKDKTVSIEIED